MMIGLFLPLSIVMSVVSFSLIAAWYVWPRLRAVPRASALIPLLFLHSFRQIGLAFLIPGVTAEALDPRFANPAAYGDLLAAVLALAAIIALRLNWSLAIPLVWIFNLEGFVDLLNALLQGFMHTQDGNLGATYFIPAFIVPALLVTHVMVFIMLWRERVLASGGVPPGPRCNHSWRGAEGLAAAFVGVGAVAAD